MVVFLLNQTTNTAINEKHRHDHQAIILIYTPVSHNSPVYPGLHPLSHFPLILLHGMSPEQCPHVWIQFGPYDFGGHAVKHWNI